MDYLFENFLDERFQEFCSVLINKKFDNVQCLPVGQPDGGRDILSFNFNKSKREFIVFQVKYVRNPKAIQDSHKWLLGIIQNEIPKIKKLIPRGAIQYILITNVSGTSHLDAGTIDKMNKLFEENIDIPSICWWRDDLCRMVEEDPIFKWNFPEILNGQDILNNILFEYINKDKERIKNIVNAYLADQYEMDNEVKFKQIDLQNNTLDLFVDVPIRAKKIDQKNNTLRYIIERSLGQDLYYDDQYLIRDSDKKKAAEFLLDPLIQENFDRILLEGGPGQGKSTISQFICQINRAKLLNKKKDINKIPESLKKAPISFPIKIDLRHIASWINKRNPYDGSITSEKFQQINNNSLESFLQCNFIYHSKIDSIIVDDIVNIFKNSSILIVFDGFDEIADLKLRQEVIDFINRGILRIKENAKKVQIIITSRPAAFTENVDFPLNLYPRFELIDLDTQVTNKYVDKWTSVNKLDDKEKKFIKVLVQEKIGQAHIRELTKSPMQLAIFLSLLKTRGESLPNKRTALYDSYIELFFNREAEKNTTIRDNRDLIINIHEYLGWLLHSEAELLKNNGIIMLEDLKAKLRSYLTREGHNTDISDELFDVVRERVCALVSRTQGTFEFEVQPLREYFCAKYLYKTAPYSNYGYEVKGTRPDRFKAILRNIYWQNVTRFYAGCFDQGELPMLIHELRELIKEEAYKNTSFGKLITSQLLSDWVFTQYPNLLKNVIDIIIDGITKGELINQDKNNLLASPINISNECGRKEIVSKAFDELRKFPKIDYAKQLINLLINNQDDNYNRWLEYYYKIERKDLKKWFSYGYRLSILHNINHDFIISFIEDESIPFKDDIYRYLVSGNALKLEYFNDAIKEKILQLVLERKLYINERNQLGDKLKSLISLCLILNFNFISHILQHNNDEFSFEAETKYIFDLKKFEPKDKIDQKIKKFYIELEDFFSAKISDLRKDNLYWLRLIDSLVESFGEYDSIRDLCISLYKLRIKPIYSPNHDYLFETEKSLFRRFQNAKYKSGNYKYWLNNLNEYKNTSYKFYFIIIFITCATPKVINELHKDIDELLKKMSKKDFDNLMKDLYPLANINPFSKKYEIEISSFFESGNFSDRLLSIISCRFIEKRKHEFIIDNIKNSRSISIINEQIFQYLCSNLISSGDSNYLELIKTYYSAMSNSYDPLEFFKYTLKINDTKMTVNTAKTIMTEAQKYPQLLVSLAEKKCFDEVCRHMVPVGQVAIDEKWF